MNQFPKIGETVKILSDIGSELENDKIGVVKARDGEYIYIKLKKSGIICERYINELEIEPLL